MWLILVAPSAIRIAASPLFLQPENLRSVFLTQPIGLGLAALGHALVIISGGIDLSIGSVVLKNGNTALHVPDREKASLL